MKTNDLTGSLLSYWFAVATGAKDVVKMEKGVCLFKYTLQDFNSTEIKFMKYEPYNDAQSMFGTMSSNDIYAIPLCKYASKGFEKSPKGPRAYDATSGRIRYNGPTLGEAVCKVMIGKVFGEEVPDL
jgi:hypothetical protein